MPQRITIIECDCKKGRLVEIARTEESGVPREGCGQDKTVFYSCDGCNQIFKEDFTRAFGTPNSTHSYGIEPEPLGLKEELIREYIPKIHGRFGDYHLKDIRDMIMKEGRCEQKAYSKKH